MSWGETIRVLGWVHVHFLWQATAIALLLGLLLALVPAAHARLRYAAGCLALALTAAVPAATAWALLPTGPDVRTATPTVVRPTEVTPTPTRPALSARTDPAPLTSPDPTGPEPWFPWAVLIWASGVGLLSAWNVVSWRRAKQLGRVGRTAPAPALAQRFRNLRQRLGVPATVELWLSDQVEGPLTLGAWRPVVLLPFSALTGLSTLELEAVLAHELAHVRRHDYLVNLIQITIETLFFHHPAVWWISQRVRLEREHCCDDVAVATCGDARSYALALAALEEGRVSPAFALPATGGALLPRIQRLLGASTAGSATPNPSLRGPGTMLTLTLIATTCAWLGTTAPAQEEAERTPIRNSQDQMDELRGLWIGRLDDRRLHLELRPRTDEVRHWGHSFGIDEEDLPEFELGDAFRMDLPREAGHLRFTGDMLGDLEKADGTGRFTFDPSEKFADDLKEMGYGRLDSREAFSLALHDVTRDFAKKVRELGPEVDLDTLVQFSIHGVTMEFITGMQARGMKGFDAKALVKMRIHGVTLAYVDGMKGLFEDQIDIDDLVSFRIHGVTPEFAQEVAGMGYPDASPKELKSLRIHGVTAEFARTVDQLVGERPTLKDLTSLRIHGANPEFIRGMTERFGTLVTGDLVTMRIHGVSKSFCDEMSLLGYQDCKVKDFVTMRIHGIGPKFIQKLIDEGEPDLSFKNVVRRKIRG